MKPNFALDLSHDGIGLVHRGKGGWALVGEVSLDDPEMVNGLELLRQKAAALESGGFSSKLIIPGSQILFTSMTAAGPDDITREARIREGLEGLTPYPVNELVFDWQPDASDPGMVHVAVVARETLSEAEAFATEHNLNPISFVARPTGSFTGEAFFGTASAGVLPDVLSNGKIVARDSRPVPDLMGAPDQPVKAQVSKPDAADPGDNDAKASGALPDLAPFPPTLDAPVDQKTPAPKDEPLHLTPSHMAPSDPVRAERAPDVDAQDTPEPAPKARAAAKRIVPPPPPPASPTDTPAFSSRRSDTAPPVPDLASPQPADIEVKPRLSFGVDRNATEAIPKPDPVPEDHKVQEPIHVPVTAPKAFGDDPTLAPPKSEAKPKPAPKDNKSAEKLASAARKGAAGVAAAAEAAGTFGRSAAKKLEQRRKEKEVSTPKVVPRPAAKIRRKPNVEQDTGVTVTAIAPLPRNIGAGVDPKSPRAREADSLTVFGARHTQQIGGKPRFLGLFLVLGLLLLMAIVAIWSMFFLTDSSAWLFPDRQDQFEAAISTQPSAATTLGDQAALEAPSLQPEVDVAPVQRDTRTPGAPDPLSPEAARARYAATGIWQRSPEPLIDPDTSQLDDLYIASIDPAAGGQDAVALPLPELSRLGSGVINTTPPPPLGTTFALDSNGLVRATPDGALTPEGAFVIAGVPPLVPAPRPGSQEVEQPQVETTSSLPQIRPRARPEGLIEGNERLQLGGRTRIEMASLRPRVRPTPPPSDAQAETGVNIGANAGADARAATIAMALGTTEGTADEVDTSQSELVTPTALAIARSIEPRQKPRNFNSIVANTRKNNASDGSVAVAAASPRQTVNPSIPTRASVAKQATIKNAINLRKVSLIGIYGSASARRALVRLPSGRYVKVGVGSRLDGGKVVSISTTQLVYRKGSRNLSLEVLPFS